MKTFIYTFICFLNFNNMNSIKTLIILLFVLIMTGCNQTKKAEKEAQLFIKSFEAQFIPLYIESAKADYQATISGKREDYQKASDLEIRISKLLGDKEIFDQVKKYGQTPEITDSLLKRQFEILENSMLRYQVDSVKMEQLINAESELEQKYSTFRAEMNGKKYSDNEIEDILVNSKDSKELKEAWFASKEIGAAVGEDVIELVKLRNEIAKSLGFSNYHEMSLKISDQDPEEIVKILDEVDNLTRQTFESVKANVDSVLSKKYKIATEEMMPWHYQNRFFQEAPKIYDVDLDTYYKGKDILQINDKYYSGIGLNVKNVLKNSDLFEKEGKNQHAYCTSIDRSGDVRVLANVRDNYQWTNTMLHELGHAVYDIYIDSLLPFALREPAHSFTTEAIANFFGSMAANSEWMKINAGVSDVEAEKIEQSAGNYTKLEKIIFSRWCQVMFRFEKSMYENPDQDLNKLWWDLVEQYQLLKRPADRSNPDWAAKVHVALYPCYYHNYLLGDLLAYQIDAYLKANILNGDTSYSNNKEIGNYLVENIFMPGNRYRWNEMIEKATGEKLTAKYYAEFFNK